MAIIHIWWNMFKILIDGDGCPVIEETLMIAEHFSIPVILVYDSSHSFMHDACEVVITDKGKDRADFVILQKVKKDDIVITQDYGLAALVLSRQAHALSQNGLRFRDNNMLSLLNQRSDAANIRRQRKRYGHMKKRTPQDDKAFLKALYAVVCELLE